MPELPDVEVFRRHLAASSLHHEIERTSVSAPEMLQGVTHQALARRLKRHQLDSTRRHGKFLFAQVSGHGWLVLHFGMTGTLKHLRRGEDQPAQTRMLIEFATGDRLAYTCQRKLGRISWADDWEDFVRQQGLGPDALSIEWPEFAQRLAEKHGTLKGALMDQSVLAGIGNVYSDEILFQMRLSPRTPTDRLDEDQRSKLFRTMRRVLEKAVRCHARPEQMPEKNFLLPHRDGDCPRCGHELKKAQVSGRSAVYCPACQSG